MENLNPKLSAIDRVIGNISEKEKQDIMEDYKKISHEQNVVREEYKQHETKKSEVTEKLFTLALARVNALCERFGVPPLGWTKDNLHTSGAVFPDNPDGTGVFLTKEQQIWIIENNSLLASPFDNLKTITHELLHAAGYNALQVDDVGGVKHEATYRGGLLVSERSGATNSSEKKVFFRNFNEAVLEEMTKGLMKECVDPILETHQRFLNEELTRLRNDPEQTSVPRDEVDDIAYIQDLWGGDFRYVLYTYGEPRRIYGKLYEKLFLANQKEYNSVEAVRDLAYRAVMQGNLLPLAKLIEKTFGVGTFRSLGEADADLEKLEAFVDSLKPMSVK